MGDVQTTATTGLSLVAIFGSGKSALYVHPSIHPAASPLCLPRGIRWRSGWPLGVIDFSPHVGHVLTTSRWSRGEDCGRAINGTPVLRQRQLPLLFSQWRLPNYGFHTCSEQKPKRLTLLCHRHVPLASNANRQSWCQRLWERGHVGRMPACWCSAEMVSEWNLFMGI